MTLKPASLTTVVYWTALVITTFNALSALAGGTAMLLTGGLGMPSAMLAAGPFSSFTWPGIILLVVVGGTQSVAAVLLLLRHKAALLWTAVSGTGMVIWIFVETVIIGGGSWLQALYFASGIAQLVIVIALLGVVSWLPRATLRPSPPTPAAASQV